MRTLIIPAAALLMLAACASPEPAPTVAAPAATSAANPTSAAPTSAAPTSAAAASPPGKLTLALVKQQVEPVFAKDPDCPKGEWVTDPANIDDRYRANVSAFGEYDCHLTDGEAVPHRVAQAIFLTFKDPHALDDYDQNELGMVPSLVDGTTVVVIGAGLKTVDMRQTLRAIEKACECGHVT
ncbi:hypothetical protein ACQP1P_13960 [Dactylosporangium sp. CA-052675]|uniref:hypothetical protein n=1 Tax=Dactylosporangium sp. CA-052675 TaxID=3239927 RepID=UPI003D916452